MAHVRKKDNQSSIKPINRLLIANRGEIARRINRTAQYMGISTVAIYADGDVDAPFVHEYCSVLQIYFFYDTPYKLTSNIFYVYY